MRARERLEAGRVPSGNLLTGRHHDGVLVAAVIDRNVAVAITGEQILARGLGGVKFHKPLICCGLQRPLELYALKPSARHADGRASRGAACI